MSAFTARRGGAIGTGGKPAVAFRTDHHLNKFVTRMLPLHREYNIPVTVALYSQALTLEVGGNGSDQVTFAALQKMALENGFEIANHSATHQDAATYDGMEAEIAGARRSLQRSLPRLPIEMFAPPGLRGTQYQGFAGDRPPSPSVTARPAGLSPPTTPCLQVTAAVTGR